MYCTRNQNGTQHKTSLFQHCHGRNNSETSPLHSHGQTSISKISTACAKQKPDAVTLRKPNSCSATPSPQTGGRRHPGASPFYMYNFTYIYIYYNGVYHMCCLYSTTCCCMFLDIGSYYPLLSLYTSPLNVIIHCPISN